MATVRAGARLHFGFANLSLAHERLYGSVGVALEEPVTVVEATPADALQVEGADGPPTVGADDPVGDDSAAVRRYARLALDLLGVPGAEVTVQSRLPRHVGLGSGTQLALATYAAVARAHDHPVDARSAAPALGRGGRSGVGIAGFERGGLVLDGGHPTARFTTDRPERGEWSVPPVIARHDLPDDWRFVLAIPGADRGRSGDEEDASMRSVVQSAAPDVADDVATTLVRGLLPAAAEGNRAAFGAAVDEIERLNGTWYADVQGGVFRPPAGAVVDALSAADVVDGVGQSSWGPTVYGLTHADRAADARAAARDALDAAGVDGDVLVAGVRNEGATIEA